MKRNVLYIAITFFVIGFASCGGDESNVTPEPTNPTDSSGSVSSTSISADVMGGVSNVTITSSSSWTASSNVDWITLNTTQGNGSATVVVNIKENPASTVRNGIISFKFGSTIKTVTVSQIARTCESSVSSIKHTSRGGTTSVNITSNATWYISTSDSWIGVNEASGQGNKTLTLTTSDNASVSPRTGTVVVKSGDIYKVVNVSQDARYLNVSQNAMTFLGKADSKIATVETDGDLNVFSSANWLTYKLENGVMTVSTTENNSDNILYGTITVQVVNITGELKRTINVTKFPTNSVGQGGFGGDVQKVRRNKK